MQNVYFFQINKISQDAIILEQLKEQGIFFSYFKVDRKHYLLLYDKKLFKIDFIIATFNYLIHLNVKKRKIRSLRGFLLYAIEIMENGRDRQILHTNLSPLFWEDVKDVIRQNRKKALDTFLFESELNESIQDSWSQNNFEEELKRVNEKLNSLEAECKSLKGNVNRLEEKVDSLDDDVNSFINEDVNSFEENKRNYAAGTKN